MNIDSKYQELFNLTNFYDEFSYEPCKHSFLEYMLKLQDLILSETATFSSQFENECKEPIYQFTTYHGLVYVYICIIKNKDKFELMCRELQYGDGKTQPFRDMLKLQNSTYVSILDDHVFSENSIPLQVSACHNIGKYVLTRDYFKTRIKKKSFSYQKTLVSSKYIENILEDVPFCVPFTCPHWETGLKKSSYKQNAYDCMPFSCRVIFWIIFAIDFIFAISIIVANLMIIIVVKKTPHLLTPHG